jgi:hypothetical protein
MITQDSLSRVQMQGTLVLWQGARRVGQRVSTRSHGLRHSKASALICLYKNWYCHSSLKYNRKNNFRLNWSVLTATLHGGLYTFSYLRKCFRQSRSVIMSWISYVAYFLTEHHSLKAYWGSGGIPPRILDLGTRYSWVVGFTPRGRAPGTHWIGGWVCPRAGMDAVMKREIPTPYRDSNPWSSSP